MAVEVRALLEKFRRGDEQSAYVELLQLSGDVIPQLIDCVRSEPQPEARAFLVKAAWERRDESIIPFLGEALMDSAEAVWQEALDGLVAFASRETLEILQSVRSRQFADDADGKRFHLWLEEAIQQVQFELRAQA